MHRDRLPFLILPATAFICILPLILQGPSCGHDFDFHILNWLEAAAQFRHGNLHPHWVFSPAWNAGEPRFVFYPPLSWTLGAILGLILPWTWTPIAYTWIAVAASGLAMHRLARAHASPTAALLASTLYLANPYMLFTAYERTAYAELLAAAFFPLLLHAVLKPRSTVPAIAIPLALLWLTNAPAAVMGTYTLALLALLRLSTTPKSRAQAKRQGNRPVIAANIILGTLLGFALAAFYILPAATQRPLVQIAMVTVPGMRIEDNTLFHHTGVSEDALAHDAVLHTASTIALILFALVGIALLSTRFRSKTLPATVAKDPSSHVGISLLLLALTIFLLLTPVALPIWKHAPQLAFLQFPWRLLAILAAVLGLATALALDRISLPPVTRSLACIILSAALTALAAPTFQQPCDIEDTIPTRLAAFQSHAGVEPTDEYTPTPADNDSLLLHDPPFWLSPDSDAKPPANQNAGSAPTEMTVNSATPQYLILNLRSYPAWQVSLNGTPLTASLLAERPRADGLVNLPIPAGTSHIALAYTINPLERVAEAISALTACALLGGMAIVRAKKSAPLHITPSNTIL